jgi:hypothetical protein
MVVRSINSSIRAACCRSCFIIQPCPSYTPTPSSPPPAAQLRVVPPAACGMQLLLCCTADGCESADTPCALLQRSRCDTAATASHQEILRVAGEGGALVHSCGVRPCVRAVCRVNHCGICAASQHQLASAGVLCFEEGLPFAVQLPQRLQVGAGG